MKKLYTLFITLFISAASFGQLIITGVVDGPLTGGIPKAVEIYVQTDIADLSIYGLGSANNGGGTDGQEFTFPADAATAGDFIYVATEVPFFTTFFGFAPNYTGGAVDVNGDDAIELFKNGTVIDVFGDINVDGSGTAWDHLDGWAYRADETVATGSTFTIANWTFSGINALDGETTNATATTPFPIGTYTPATASVEKNQIAGFSMYPNPVVHGKILISSNNSAAKQVAIYNLVGQQVYNKSVIANVPINVTSLTKGMYILKVEEEGKIAIRKLLIN
jgi:hypothetical protein